jgi:hypothetical protein
MTMVRPALFPLFPVARDTRAGRDDGPKPLTLPCESGSPPGPLPSGDFKVPLAAGQR